MSTKMTIWALKWKKFRLLLRLNLPLHNNNNNLSLHPLQSQHLHLHQWRLRLLGLYRRTHSAAQVLSEGRHLVNLHHRQRSQFLLSRRRPLPSQSPPHLMRPRPMQHHLPSPTSFRLPRFFSNHNQPHQHPLHSDRAKSLPRD